MINLNLIVKVVQNFRPRWNHRDQIAHLAKVAGEEIQAKKS